jgi:ribosomal protein S13
MKRLKQVALQQRGDQGIGDPEIIKKLELTEEQQKKLLEVQQEILQEMLKAFQDPANFQDFTKMFRLFQDLQSKLNEQLEAILTAEQKSRLRRELGEPVKGLTRQAGASPGK